MAFPSTLASVATARDGAQTTFNWTSESSSSRVLCTSSHLVILLPSYEPNRARHPVLLILMILLNASPCGEGCINSKSINWCTIRLSWSLILLTGSLIDESCSTLELWLGLSSCNKGRILGQGFSVLQGGFFNWSALKMTKYKEKLKYLNWSANCSSQKVLSVKPQ